MDYQPKITRSKARHLRRKKLIIARRAAENSLANVSVENNGEIEEKITNSQGLNNKENIQVDAHLISSSYKKVINKDDLKQESSNQKISNPHKSSSGKEKQESKVDSSRSTQCATLLDPNRILNQELSDLLKDSRQINLKSDYNDTFFSTLEDIVAKLNTISLPPSEELPAEKMNSAEKTKDQIKAEREAKKAAKAASKKKVKGTTNEAEVSKPETPQETKANTKEMNLSPKETKVKVKETKVIPKESETKSKLDHDSISRELKDIKKELDNILYVSPVTTETLSGKEVKEEKSKAQLRAERRAKQEAQRAAKQEQTDKKKQKSTQSKLGAQPQISEVVKKTFPKSVAKENLHEVNLFKHLYHEREIALRSASDLKIKIHPEIIKLGVKYANKIIVGSNARCVALLQAVKHLIEDFERPSQADFTRGLEASLQDSAIYLHNCRPLAVSMQNALKHLKWQMSLLSATISDQEAKIKLSNEIDTYIQEQILLADKAISIKIQTKISNGDMILTYGFSSLIYKILCDAHTAGRQFQVVVVDGRPWLEGKEMLKRLVNHGIECSYILIHALSFILPKVDKVFLGAHAILANGSVMSRAGSAQIALMAKAFNVPVLVACETHKSCERAQTDSIVYNEIGNADALTETFSYDSKKSSLANWKSKKSLNLLNITYDVTPADLVTAVVTELAILPPSSVPVILRIKPSEI